MPDQALPRTYHNGLSETTLESDNYTTGILDGSELLIAGSPLSKLA